MKKLLTGIFILLQLCAYCQFETTPEVSWRPSAAGQISTWTQAQMNAAGNWISGHVNEGSEGVRNAQGYFDNLASLSEGECAPDFSTDNSAQMNSTCAEEASCQTCYTQATNKMNFFRRQLARLNCIYKNTTGFSASAISFGDTYSGFHAMSGAAWQVQRAKITNSLTTLKATYDRKYIEFIEGLKGALMEFDNCENQYGSGDWYAKSGFIYFEFMKERYKRSD